ncbi:MAG: type II toxin-antitoxin system RelE/ParE family toxin [Fibromonadaceae bacterium]|jgi:plasmid stabilization system protein ParE|nr:type II toxin-antitoxin system RelE/ParE family toxin [Fibromonadaceae bacterium]
MATTLNDDEVKIKPAITSLECEEMLNEALAYIAKKSIKQARIMYSHFKQILKLLEKQPKIGTKYFNDMRKMLLGKFPYYIYYIEQEECIYIVGIWHTSRGTEFIYR